MYLCWFTFTLHEHEKETPTNAHMGNHIHHLSGGYHDNLVLSSDDQIVTIGWLCVQESSKTYEGILCGYMEFKIKNIVYFTIF